MLPPGTQFDLFRGTAPVTIEDETYPTRLYRTIRVCYFFYSVALCELCICTYMLVKMVRLHPQSMIFLYTR